MDYLRDGIGLRWTLGREPIVEYEREGFDMYGAMTEAIKEESVGYVFNLDASGRATGGQEGLESGLVRMGCTSPRRRWTRRRGSSKGTSNRPTRFRRLRRRVWPMRSRARSGVRLGRGTVGSASGRGPAGRWARAGRTGLVAQFPAPLKGHRWDSPVLLWRRCGNNGGMSDSPAPLADPHLVFDPVDGVRDVVILGSTGSIGTQAIDLVLRNPDRFRVTALSAAGGRVGLLAEQAHRLRVADGRRRARGRRTGAAEALRGAVRRRVSPSPRSSPGPDAATHLAASDCHTVLNGITGSIGLAPTLAALEAGRTLALANKESLIVGGPLVKALAKPGQIIPVDSEHAALFQALAAGTRADVRKLVVTASGGPFRGRTKAELADVTPEDALAHPTWAMGPVITINSATLVNKGLEVIEAHLLYDIPFERIEVVVHPQSYVHSMVEFTDGSTIAQATPPDMRGPDRHRPRLARAGPRRGARLRLDEGVELGVLPARHRRVSVGRARPARRAARGHGPGGVQCRQRGVRGRVPERRAAVQRDHGDRHDGGRGTRHTRVRELP